MAAAAAPRRTCACLEVSYVSSSSHCESSVTSLLSAHSLTMHASYPSPEKERSLFNVLVSFPSSQERDVLASIASSPSDVDVKGVEVAATCPCLLPVQPVTQKDLAMEFSTNDEEHFLKFGVLISPKGSTTNSDHTISALRSLVQTHCDAADEALARRDITGTNETFDFREISSRGGKRFDQILASGIAKNVDTDFVCMPPSKAVDDDGVQALVHLARNAAWIPLVDSLLGKDEWRCQCSAVYSRRGSPDQRWHSDGAHVQAGAGYFTEDMPLSGMGGEGEATPYAVCVFLALDACGPSTNGVGATSFWPGSHAREQLVGFGAFADAMDLSVEADLNPGGFVVYDYRLLHKGMAFDEHARTCDGSNQRSLIQFVYHKTWYKERRNYGQHSLFET